MTGCSAQIAGLVAMSRGLSAAPWIEGCEAGIVGSRRTSLGE